MSDIIVRPPMGIAAAHEKRGVHVRQSRLGQRWPTMRLIHKITTSQEAQQGYVPGAYLVGYGQGARVLVAPTVVPLTAREFRQYDRTEGGKFVTLCTSSNGVKPSSDVANPPAPVCTQCPLGEWGKGDMNLRTGKPRAIPPVCQEGIVFLLAVRDLDNALAWFPCRGTAAKPAMEFVRAYMSDQVIMALHEYSLQLGATAITSGGLSWYTPTFNVVETQAAATYDPMYQVHRETMYLPFLSSYSAGTVPTEQGDNEIPF